VLSVVTSGKAAPGVTTLAWALALGWPGGVLAADCDPAGGDMAPGLLAGRVGTEHGLLSWAAAARRGVPAMTAAALFAEHVVELPEQRGVWFLPGFATAAQGRSFTGEVWERLALALARSSSAVGRDAVVDAGRLVGEAGNGPLLRAADAVLLVVRPSVRSVHAAQDAATRLRQELGDLDTVSAVVVGSGPYPAGEVAAALQVRLAVTVPDDRSAAAVLSDGASGSLLRPLARSQLLRAAQGLAHGLAAAAADPTADPAGATR
jgi:MinD-like ATPase involved in chromosome partitioning or flagellar assembly